MLRRKYFNRKKIRPSMDTKNETRKMSMNEIINGSVSQLNQVEKRFKLIS